MKLMPSINFSFKFYLSEQYIRKISNKEVIYTKTDYENNVLSILTSGVVNNIDKILSLKYLKDAYRVSVETKYQEILLTEGVCTPIVEISGYFLDDSDTLDTSCTIVDLEFSVENTILDNPNLDDKFELDAIFFKGNKRSFPMKYENVR